jgi:hypothetical protein
MDSAERCCVAASRRIHVTIPFVTWSDSRRQIIENPGFGGGFAPCGAICCVGHKADTMSRLRGLRLP